MHSIVLRNRIPLTRRTCGAMAIASRNLYESSIRDPVKFWGEAADDIKWHTKPSTILDDSNPPFYRWFKDGTMNTCYNAVDRHLEERKDQFALIYDSPVTNTIKKLTYGELYEKVNEFSSLLRTLGVNKGDRVVIYMPNMLESVIGMLSCARLGAIHSVVFGGFAPAELAVRIRDSKPKVILTASCGIDGAKVIPYKPLLDAALELAKDDHKVQNCIVLQRPQVKATLVDGRDIEWEQALTLVNKGARIDPVPVSSTDPLYILYTSGTTGKPKGIVRDNGGHCTALRWAMKHVFNSKPGEVFWAASDIGWVVGHSFIVYGPLFQGLSTVLYEGKPIGTPDAANFWRTIERHRVNTLFTAPTALRAIKRLDHDGLLVKDFSLKSLHSVFLAGERADPASIHWAENTLKVPILDNWWQTETGWPICANQVGIHGFLPIKYGSCFRPCPGYNLQIVDNDMRPVPAGDMGNLVVQLPLPPGAMTTLYNNDQRFVDSYMSRFPGYYDTGDVGMIDEDGYTYVMSRSDDVINVAGHRLSTGQMEEILANHPDVAEVAVIGIRDGFKGQAPLGLLVLNADCTRTEDTVVSEAVNMIREQIGAVAAFKKAVVVSRLPKTRSGKILRATLRSIANHDPYTVPATIEDPAVLQEVEKIIRAHEND